MTGRHSTITDAQRADGRRLRGSEPSPYSQAPAPATFNHEELRFNLQRGSLFPGTVNLTRASTLHFLL
jgi:hypothetical protein